MSQFCKIGHRIPSANANSFMSAFRSSLDILDAKGSSITTTNMHDAIPLVESAHGDIQAPKEERSGVGTCSGVRHAHLCICIGVDRAIGRAIPAGLKVISQQNVLCSSRARYLRISSCASSLLSVVAERGI